jgi:hypothetical protein
MLHRGPDESGAALVFAVLPTVSTRRPSGEGGLVIEITFRMRLRTGGSRDYQGGRPGRGCLIPTLRERRHPGVSFSFPVAHRAGRPSAGGQAHADPENGRGSDQNRSNTHRSRYSCRLDRRPKVGCRNLCSLALRRACSSLGQTARNGRGGCGTRARGWPLPKSEQEPRPSGWAATPRGRSVA